MIGLLSAILTPRMCPFNPLFLPLAATMRHCSHQVDKHVIEGGYHGTSYRISLRSIFI